MQSSELKIFLASPLDLSRERILIGSHIGLLNTFYDEQGKYITLNKWEDYNATYAGLRTQSLYNNDLLEPSDIVIILLYSRPGQYTVEEFERASELNKKIIIAIKHDRNVSEVPDEVIAFSDRIRQSKYYYKTWDFYDDETLIALFDSLAIDNLGKYELALDNNNENYCCYVAYSDKMLFGAEELRDAIRAFDQQKRSRGIRCLMLPFKTPALIQTSNYNFCLYLEEPDMDFYGEADKMYELADAKRSKLLKCKFYDKNAKYPNLPFDKRFPNDFGKAFAIDVSSPEIHIDSIKDSLVREFEPHYEEFYQDKLLSRYTFKDGKLYINGIEHPIDESIASLIAEGIIAKFKQEVRLTADYIVTDRSYINHSANAERIRKILQIRYPSLIRLSALLENIPNEDDILPEDVLQLWQENDYANLIEAVRYRDISLDKKYVKHSLTNSELLERLALCNIKLKAIFRSSESSRYKTIIPNLLEERLNITEAIYKSTTDFVEDVILSHILLSLYYIGNNHHYYKVLERFLHFVDKAGNDDILADCEFRFDYADILISQNRFDVANKQLEIGFSKLSRDSIEKRKFDYQLGEHIFQLIEIYLRYRLYIDNVKRWISYWEKALLENKDNSTIWCLSYLMMSAAKFRTFNINSRADDKEGLQELNDNVSGIFIRALNSYLDLDDSMKLDLAYTANIMGVYYTDRIDFTDNKPLYKEYAFYYLNVAEFIINEVSKRDKLSAIPFYSQTYHNLGRTYDVHGQHKIALGYYKKAYKYRKYMYETDRSSSSAGLLAETATNLSGALLFYNPEDALNFAKEAESLYIRLAKKEKGEEAEMNVLKARQLIATIYYENEDTKERGLQMYQEIWSWVEKHSDCSYFMSFVEHSLRVLIENDRIPYIVTDDGSREVSLKDGGIIGFRPTQQ